MKRDYISDIRYCEKLKQSQSFKTVDGLQKKVRKKIKLINYNPKENKEPYDAQKQLRQIICFWKQGWDYDHFHPVFLNPEVFYPIVCIADPQEQTIEELHDYALLIKSIIDRLKIDQEIEVNYKIQSRPYITDWVSKDITDPEWKYYKTATLASEHLLKCFSNVTQQMVQSALQSIQEVEAEHQDLEQEDLNRVGQIHRQLLYLQKIIQRSNAGKVSSSSSMKQESYGNDSEMKEESQVKTIIELQEMNKFIANVTLILDQMKNKESGPALISVQPKVGELTYVLHPVLWAVYALFYKESIAIKHINILEQELNREYEYNNEKSQHSSKQIQSENKLKIASAWNQLLEIKEEHLIHIKDNLKRENQEHSKVVFINLDGYESEFNLELAKNFHKNMIYVSFPKFETNSETGVSSYEQRFYNKLLFETTRISNDNEVTNQELKKMYQHQKLINSPEQYHQHIETLYKQNHSKEKETNSKQKIQENIKNGFKDGDKFRMEEDEEEHLNIIDRSQRIYVFPIKMWSLLLQNKEDFPEVEFNEKTQDTGSYSKSKEKFRVEASSMEEEGREGEPERVCEVVENYESYFIRFLMRKYLYGRIHKFRASHIIISFSNRVMIENSHFVEMIQELTNISKCKIMFFPNFTTSFVDKIMLRVPENNEEEEEEMEEELINCYAISNARLQMSKKNVFMDSMAVKGYDNCPLTLQFLGKVMRYLKIASGTYNLQQNFEYEPFAIKLKTVKLYPYIEFLFNVLSKEYSDLGNKIDKEMLKADKFFLEERIKEEQEDLRRCVAKFYRDLFKVLERLVVEGIYEETAIEEESERESEEGGVGRSPYTMDVRRVFETWTGIRDREGMKKMRAVLKSRIKEPFDEFIGSEEKEKMDAKYENYYQMYFKLRPEHQQFREKIELNSKQANYGMRQVQFFTHTSNFQEQKPFFIKDKLPLQTKQNKIPLPIYKDTSVLFQTNQVKNTQAIVLVMNHLGLKDEYVNHYIGSLPLERNVDTFTCSQCTVRPITFHDHEGVIQPHKFKARCQWNYKQTEHFLILYWPSEYDFIKAALFKMMKQQYEPRITHDIFIAKRNKEEMHLFYKVQVNLDISASKVLPRRGTSAYNYKNMVYIFGGHYQREYNYMEVQNDIVVIDLNELSPNYNIKKQKMGESQQVQKMAQLSICKEGQFDNINLENRALTLRNIKNKLYSQEYMNSLIAQKSQKPIDKKLNSLIRPKLQLEFFQIQDIAKPSLSESFANSQHDFVIMMGGYGENFMFPHSLLTYFYHLLKFDKNTRELKSVEKKNILEKPVPINLKELVKNKNIFQNFSILNKGEKTQIVQGLTQEQHYIFHRAVFRLSNIPNDNKDDKVEEKVESKKGVKKDAKKEQNRVGKNEIIHISYKLILLYATEMYSEMDKNYQRFAQKIGEVRVVEQSEGVKIEMVNGCNNSLFISNEDGTFLYSLNFKPEQSHNNQLIPLTNEAILTLDVFASIVYAIVKHKQYTKDKCILACQKIVMPDPKYSFHNNNHYVNLFHFLQFQENYELHTLLMMKKNQILIIHGLSFEEYFVNDRIITTKYVKGDVLKQIKNQQSFQIPTPTVSLKLFYECTSFISRQKQKITHLNFLSSQSKQQDFMYACLKYSMEMSGNIDKKWKLEGEGIKWMTFFYKDKQEGGKEVYLRKVQFVEMRQNTKHKLADSKCIIVPLAPLALSQDKFFFTFDKIKDNDESFNYNNKKVYKVQVHKVEEKEVWSMVCWRRTYKNQERYEDCGIRLRSEIQKI